MRRFYLSTQLINTILILLLAFPIFLSAQQRGARLEGTVVDSTGLIIPGVLVVVRNQETSVALEALTNEAGIYAFPVLTPGTYTVSAELKGFKKSSVTDFKLEVATTKVLDFRLDIGELSEEVVVKADAIQQVQTSTSDLGDVVFERKIKDLPLNGRTPLQLVFLQPGMVGLSASGSRIINNSISMDGVDITNSELGTGSSSGIAIATDVSPSVDAIEEFRVITTNPSAEYGRSSGFQVEVATKSGTNAIHGSAYDFYRSTALNANSFFNNASATTIERPLLQRHQFGATLGGPVYLPWLYNGKNRTFFFFNYEGQRQAQGITLNRTVMTKEAREGLYRFITPGVTKNPDTGANLTSNSRVIVDPVTGAIRSGVQGIQTLNIIENDKKYYDGIGADATGLAKKMIDATPLPNEFGLGGDGLNYAYFRWRAPAISNNDLFTYKVDHVFTPKHNISVRVSHGRVDRFGDTINGVYAPYPGGQAQNRFERQLGASLNYFSGFRPNLTNEFRIGVTRNLRRFSSTQNTPGVLAISTTYAATLMTNPFLISEPQVTARQTFQITDNISWIKNRHAIRAGFSMHSSPINETTGDNAIGLGFASNQTNIGGAQIDFPLLFGNPTGSNPIPSSNVLYAGDLFNFLVGRIGPVWANFNAISETAFGPQGTGKTRGFRSRDWGFYLQDDWKFRKNLTLNLGVRYDYFQVPWEVNSFYVLTANRLLLDPMLDPKLPHVPVSFARVGPEFNNQIYKDDFNNFAPVIGFSWDPFGKNKTAVRGSYRVSYDHLYSDTLQVIEARAPGLNGTGQINGQELSRQFPLNNAFGQPRTPRLQDIKSTPTHIGISVGNGSIDLRQVVDITKTQKPLAILTNERWSLNPSDYEKTLVSPYSQSWSFGIQHEIMRNTVLEVRYVGRKGTKEFGGLTANQFRAPADILQGLREVRGLLNMTNAQAYAKAGIPLPSGVNGSALTSISTFYGSASASATKASQYTPGALAVLAPKSLYKLMLAGNNTTDSTVEQRLRENNLVSTIAQFDTSANIHNNSFLQAMGLPQVPAGVPLKGALPIIAGLQDNVFRPNLQFLNGPRVVSNAFYSSYHAMQLQLNRRFYNGLQFQWNYTLSKNLDITSTNAPSDASITDFFQRNVNYGPSGNDITHDMEMNLIWELPFGPGKWLGKDLTGWKAHLAGGWQVSSIIGANSGDGLTLGYSTDSTCWQGGAWPDIASGAKVNGETNDIGHVYRNNTGGIQYWSADDFSGMFQHAQLGTIGTASGLYLRGPGGWDWDLSVLKDINITEGIQLQLRGEFFNVWNHAVFSNPSTTIDSGTFGIITGSSGPRVIQLAAKIYF